MPTGLFSYAMLCCATVKAGGLYVAINGQYGEWVWGVLDSFARPLGLSAQREGYHHFGLLEPRTSEMQRLTRWYDEGKLGQA